MRTIYLDSDYKCHVEPDTGRTATQTAFFDGKCNAYIEGYRFVPQGATWTRADGELFHGEMAAPIIDHELLRTVQRVYEEISEIQDVILGGMPQ